MPTNITSTHDQIAFQLRPALIKQLQTNQFAQTLLQRVLKMYQPLVNQFADEVNHQQPVGITFDILGHNLMQTLFDGLQTIEAQYHVLFYESEIKPFDDLFDEFSVQLQSIPAGLLFNEVYTETKRYGILKDLVNFAQTPDVGYNVFELLSPATGMENTCGELADQLVTTMKLGDSHAD